MVPEVCWGQIWQNPGLFYHLFLVIIFMLIWLASASSQCSLVLKVCRNTTIGCTGIVRCHESEGKPPVTIGSGEQGVCVKNSLRSARCAGRERGPAGRPGAHPAGCGSARPAPFSGGARGGGPAPSPYRPLPAPCSRAGLRGAQRAGRHGGLGRRAGAAGAAGAARRAPPRCRRLCRPRAVLPGPRPGVSEPRPAARRLPRALLLRPGVCPHPRLLPRLRRDLPR